MEYNPSWRARRPRRPLLYRAARLRRPLSYRRVERSRGALCFGTGGASRARDYARGATFRRFFVDDGKGALATGGRHRNGGGPISTGSPTCLATQEGEIDGVTGGWGLVRGGRGAYTRRCRAAARGRDPHERRGRRHRRGRRPGDCCQHDGRASIEAGPVVSGAHHQPTLLSLLGVENFAELTGSSRPSERSPRPRQSRAHRLPDFPAMQGKELDRSTPRS